MSENNNFSRRNKKEPKKNSLKIPYALEELSGLGVKVRLLGNYAVYSLGEV